MQVRSIRDADVKGKRVLVRCDFNVPLKDGVIVEDMRIRAAVPTIELLHAQGAASIILITHIGRPKGVDESLRVAPVAARLRELTKAPFELRENLRFDPRDEANDPALASELAALADIFINEAFSVSHRAEASTVGVALLLPSFAGLRVEEEIEKLSKALTPPPGSLAMIGGAKFETKQPLIEKLLSLYGKVLLGGALGNDMVKARGLPFGKSLISNIPVPESIAGNDNLLSPTDAAFIGGEMDGRTSFITDTRADEAIADIGPNTAEAWSKEIISAPFVLWNGPMGIYEQGFTSGTDTLAQALVTSRVSAVIGGGDTAAAVSKFTFDPARVFISSGGGAMLEFIENGTLPALEVLKK